MHPIISAGIILLIAGAMLLAVVYAFVSGIRQARSWRGIVTLVGAIMFLLGICGFFGAALSTTGALDWLGSYEWPIGYTGGVVRSPNGLYVVPHTPSNRVQLYDADLRFIRGWRIDGGGGIFTVRAPADGTISIHTARGHQHLVYDQTGKLLSQNAYDVGMKPSPTDTPPESFGVRIPTPWFLWPMTGPFYAWVCAVAGMILWSKVDVSGGGRGPAVRRTALGAVWARVRRRSASKPSVA